MDAAKFITVLARLHSGPRRSTGGAAQYLGTAQLVERWDSAVHIGTLANRRAQGRGPEFVKVGAKVLYPLDRLEEWERAQLRAAGVKHGMEDGK